MKKRTETMFWLDFHLEEIPYNCSNPERYEELKRLVETAPTRAHNVREDVRYKNIVTMDLILKNINWFLSANQCVVFGICAMPMTAKEIANSKLRRTFGGIFGGGGFTWRT